MGRFSVLLYGVAAYVAFLVTILYLIAFVGNWPVPKTIDSGAPGTLLSSTLINVALLALFGVSHSIMARSWFKAWLTRFVPESAERSTFVLVASLVLALIMWQWRPTGVVLWSVETPVLQAMLMGVSLAGWGLLLYSSFLIDHFDLFGLRQVVLQFLGRPYTAPHFQCRSVYKLIRHPLMSGVLIGIWVTPQMTQSHLLFSTLMTVYILIGVYFEERALLRTLGDDYRRYRADTPMFFPHLGKGHSVTKKPAGM